MIVGTILAKMESALILRMITNVSVNLVIKVSKFQNESMKSSYEPNIVRISALYCDTLLYYNTGQKSLQRLVLILEKRWLYKSILKFTDL